ncbi:hypothetical protein DL768_005711 [Monosporascus sp. mg162]|nr:hypothetical protein DL768_005711 [Monosporascus sp. mg162]
MSTSAEATVPTLAQQLQKRVQQLKAYVQQFTAQAAAPDDSVPTAGWVDDENDILIDVFYKELKDDIKDEIIKIERPSAFDKYIVKAVKIDNRKFEQRQERHKQFALRSKFQGTN